jgi:hypothetical protein
MASPSIRDERLIHARTPELRLTAWIVIGALLLPGCAHDRQDATPAPAPSIAALTLSASPSQSSYVKQYAIFSSKTTGRIRLDDIRGNAHQCRATKLFIGLADRSDLSLFVRLTKSHQVLDSVTIDDPTSGHQVYKLHGVIATGKTIRSPYSPLIALEFTKMTVTGCDPSKSSVAPVIVPKLQIP